MAWDETPGFKRLAGKGEKKYAASCYKVQDKRFVRDIYFQSATKTGENGYMEVCIPRLYKPRDGWKDSHLEWVRKKAECIVDTMLHEMGHVWQFRNKDEAVVDYGSRSWREFYGYSSPTSYKMVAYDRQPIEIHVRQMIKRVAPTSSPDRKRRREIITNIMQMMIDGAE